ncbi:MAG: MarR family transcriptional regulator [Simkaniaceae bacterium]|nr:MarR family transcriptional regulator [Simkaniaceae bacterium]
MEFGELLKAFLQDLQAIFRKQIIFQGLTLPQILILSSIPDTGIDMSSLAKVSGVDNSTMTRLADTMIKRGWIAKKRDDMDRRSFILRLTEQGENLQLEIENRIDKFGEEVASQIPLEEREEVKDVLSAFHWTLSKLILKKQ